VDAAEGEDTGVYGDKLTAVPQPDIESTTRPEDIDDVLGGQHYFHGATQRALWNLGDYGVAADAWRLFNGPAHHLALAEQESWVLCLEAMARLERQGYQREKTNLLWDLSTTRQRLHEARVLERLHPYLKRDGSGKEQHIPPVRTRGAQANLVEARRNRRAQHTCPYCKQQGHYRHTCRHPHFHCQRINSRLCEIPLTHRYFNDFPEDCPVQGRKTNAELAFYEENPGPSRTRDSREEMVISSGESSQATTGHA
jgi:hypothetical protein